MVSASAEAPSHMVAWNLERLCTHDLRKALKELDEDS